MYAFAFDSKLSHLPFRLVRSDLALFSSAYLSSFSLLINSHACSTVFTFASILLTLSSKSDTFGVYRIYSLLYLIKLSSDSFICFMSLIITVAHLGGPMACCGGIPYVVI